MTAFYLAAVSASALSTTLADFRDEVSALGDSTWLNCQGVAPGARSVVDALCSAASLWRDGRFDWMAWDSDAEAARTLICAQLRRPPEQVALVSNLAEAAATVAHSIANGAPMWSGRRTVLVGAGEFRSNLFPWLALREVGVAVRSIGATDGTMRSADIIDALDDDVALVALSDVQSQCGVRINMAAVLDACRAHGALLFVNTTQSAGVLRTPIAADAPDFIAAHSYKWQLAPRGATWLCVADRWVGTLTSISPNWKNVRDPYDCLYGGPLNWSATARRLDSSLAWYSWVGARAALELLGRFDEAAIETQALSLAAKCAGELMSRGVELPASELPTHLLGVRYATAYGAHAEQERLLTKGIVLSSRGAWLCFGFHGFNSGDDLERLLDNLRLP